VSAELLKRIDLLCKEKGIPRRTMEKEAGISIGASSKWKEKNPNQTSLQKLSDYFGVSIAYLVGESEFRSEDEAMIHNWMQNNDQSILADETKRFEAGIRIPVLSTVHAGIPCEAIEDMVDENTDWEEITLRQSKTGHFFALKIIGDSMTPRFEEGDVVIVRCQPDANSGDIVIAKVNGDDACCKKLIKNKDGITLVSLNPKYDPMYFDLNDIQKKPVTIVGKVVELRAKF